MSSIRQQISLLIQSKSSFNIDREDLESNETLSHSRNVDDRVDLGKNFESTSRWSKGVGADFKIGSDEKYVSEKISRKDITNSDSDSEISVSEGEYESFQEMLTQELDGQTETIDETESSQLDSVSDGESEVSKASDFNDDDELKGIIKMNQKSSEKDAKKGRAIIKQYKTWEGVLESRIHLQSCLAIANSLPYPNEFASFCEQAGTLADEPMCNAKSSLNEMITELVKLQTSMIEANKFKGTTLAKTQTSTQQFKAWLSEYQNDVIREWEGKTRLLSSAFTRKGYVSVERSVLQQIEYALSKSENLIKKTQVKRLEFDGLGKRKKVEMCEDTSAKKRDLNLGTYDDNIFDDTDFYNQLLQDLIRSKTTSDIGESSYKWLEMNRNRSNKIKRNINTKASKGRKIRYDVYQKLVSFMAPVDDSIVNDASKNELFRSLFGQTNMIVEP